MSDARTRITVWITLGVLVLVVLGLTIVSIAMATGGLQGDSFPGQTYLAVLNNTNALSAIFAGVVAILTAGVNIMARATTPAWLLYTTSALCVAGLLACLWLFLGLKDPEVAASVWSVSSPVTSPAQLQAGNQFFLVVMAGWLASFLGTQLLITATRGRQDPVPPPQP